MEGGRSSRKASKRSYVDEDSVNEGNQEISDLESEEERPTQRSRGRVKRNRIDHDDLYDENSDVERENDSPNKECSAAGQIAKVYVENFMCHKKLTIDFNRHLTFVGGVNGSGKSAIAAAIQVCLGASARATGRGNNNATMIREGSNGPAIIRVFLRNEGDDAYKPKEYGDIIVVERKINKPTGGGYQLMNKKLEVISRDKKDLEEMLKSFNIYVDNPCNVLSQEESKKFIQGSESEKYDFFLKATGLHRTKDELQETSKAILATKEERIKHDERRDEKKKAFKESNEILKRLTALDKTEDDIKMCRAKAYWDDHRVAKVTAEQKEAIVEERQAELDEAVRKMEIASLDKDDDDHLRSITDKLETLQDGINTAEKERDLKQAKVLSITKSVNAQKNDLTKISAAKTDYSSQIKSANKDLENLKRKQLEEAEKGEAELKKVIERIEHINNDIANRQEKEQAMRNDHQMALEEANRIGKQVQQQSAALNQKGREVQKTQEKLNTQSDSQSKAKMFGNAVPQILERMQQARFSKPIFGPIGMCISMKEGTDQWGLAVEKSLVHILRTFIVSTSEDRATLSGILRQFNGNVHHPIILQHESARYRVPDSPEGVITVADTLMIQDDLVFNALVDQTGMERMALIAEEEHYRHYVTQIQGRDSLKYHLSTLVTKNGTTIKFADGNRSSEVNRSPFNHFLSNDNTAYRESLRQQLNAEQEDFKTTSTQLNELKRSNEQVQKRPPAIDRAIRENAIEIQKLNRLKNDAEGQRDEMQIVNRFDTKDVENELVELHRALEEVNVQYAATEAQLQTINVEFKAAQSEKKECDRVVETLKGEANELQTLLEKAINKRQDAKRQRESLGKIVATKQKQLDEEKELLKTVTQILEEKLTVATAKAMELVDGVEIVLDKKETRAVLEKRERELRVQLEEGRRLAGVEGYNKEQVTLQTKKLLDEYRSFQKDCEKLSKNIEDLETDFELRSKKWSQLLKGCSNKSKHKFDDYIQKKGFSGTVEFNHKEHKLKIVVQTDCADSATTSKDCKQLSGGERSYTTFCFLLALGHVIECPFRLFDEYDVFMDEQARQTTLDALVSYSMSAIQKERQFIVITPNKLNHVLRFNHPHVKVVKMGDPKAMIQSAHGLQQQTIDL